MKDFLSFARERYSVRAYSEKSVEDEKIDLIIEAALAAPTACNYQPQKILIVKSEEKRRLLAELSPCTFNAPVVFVICADENIAAKRGEERSFGETDAAIACTHMMLEAYELGLGSCWVGRFNPEEVKKALDLPENIKVWNLLPVGYAAPGAEPFALHSKSRTADEVAEII